MKENLTVSPSTCCLVLDRLGEGMPFNSRARLSAPTFMNDSLQPSKEPLPWWWNCLSVRRMLIEQPGRALKLLTSLEP